MRNLTGVTHSSSAAILLAGLIALGTSLGCSGAKDGVARGIIGHPEPPDRHNATVIWDQGTATVDWGPGAASGRLKAGIVMTDLLKIDDRLLMAATDGKTIEVLEIADRLRPLAGSDAGDHGQILSLSWWHPSDLGPYLTVVAWSNHTVAASILTLESDRLVPVAEGLETILGAFDTDGDGLPETLLSQEFDPEDFFGRRIKELYWDRGKLKRRSPGVDLAPKFTVIGGQLADLTGDGQLETVYMRNGVLWISAGSKELFASGKQMGGSLSRLIYKKNPDAKDFISTSVFLEVSPVAVDMDGDGSLEVVAIASDQSAFKAPGIATGIKNSRLMVFKYQDGGFIKGTLGGMVAAAIQGLAVVDGRVWYVTSETGTLFRPGGASRLHVLSLGD